MAKYTKIEFTIKNSKGIKIKLFKSEDSCYCKIHILKSLMKSNTFEKKDFNNTLYIKIRDDKRFKEEQQAFNKKWWKFDSELYSDYYVFNTEIFTFNPKWKLLPFKSIKENICLKEASSNGPIKIRLTISKKLFIHDSWFGSYSNFQNRQKLNNTPNRIGYISNRNNANFSYNNARNPYQGGAVNPK